MISYCKAMIIHVENEILTHDCQANQGNISSEKRKEKSLFNTCHYCIQVYILTGTCILEVFEKVYNKYNNMHIISKAFNSSDAD